MNSRAFGRPATDISASHIQAPSMTTRRMSSTTHVDPNYLLIESDIYQIIQQLETYRDVILDQQKILEKQKKVLDDHDETMSVLHTYHQPPWFTKESYTFCEFDSNDWKDNTVPPDSESLFVKRIVLPHKFKAMFVIFRHSNKIGEPRHACLMPKHGEAVVYVTSHPNFARRLTSFDLEWMPPGPNSNHAEVMVGHHSLLKSPQDMNGYLFGATSESSSGGQCVVLSEGGGFYIKALYIDTSLPQYELVLVGEKYKNTLNTHLGGFCAYGVDDTST